MNNKTKRQYPLTPSLLLAGVQVYGATGRPEAMTNPQWYRRKPQQGVTTNELINQLRSELWASTLKSNFTRFSSKTSTDQNASKSDLPILLSIPRFSSV